MRVLKLGDFISSDFSIEVTIGLWLVPSGRLSNQDRPILLLGHAYEELPGL